MKALLPDRHSTKDFFVCDIFDALPGFRDDTASMEHPVFSLSTKPDHRVLEYEHNGNTITIKPGYHGLATIHDKDVLLYCMSYLRAALQQGKEINQRVRITAHDLLVSTNRPTNDDSYIRLANALRRLEGTRIETNIKTGDIEIMAGFGMIDSWHIVRKNGRTGRMLAVEIKLSDWIFNALLSDELLSINRDYFRLRKPLERRLYELARKHCGEQNSFTIGLEKLKLKTGSNSPDKQFKYLVGKIAATDQAQKHFPDYSVHLNDNNTVTFFNRRQKQKETPGNDSPTLATWAYEKAKKAAPRLDVYTVEQDFKAWVQGKPEPDKGYEAAFIGFCKKKANEQELI